jgi:hypothetical protein
MAEQGAAATTRPEGVLLTAALMALCNVLSVTISIQLPLAAFLLWWLNTKRVKAFYKRRDPARATNVTTLPLPVCRRRR